VNVSLTLDLTKPPATTRSMEGTIQVPIPSNQFTLSVTVALNKLEHFDPRNFFRLVRFIACEQSWYYKTYMIVITYFIVR
jgi:hypothetical protein